jgi:hypothetical protein
MLACSSTKRILLPFLVTSMGFVLTFTQPANAADADGNDWYYCLSTCPNLIEFCTPRGGYELAYCEFKKCWGPNTEQWYDWTVQC